MPAERPCPVDGCCSPVKHGQLLCLEHWRATPRDMQREVNATWRRYRYDPEAYLVARGNVLAHHNNGGGSRTSDSGAQGRLL